MDSKSLSGKVSKGVGQMFKIFTFQNPFNEELYYIQYKMNGLQLVATATGKNGSDAGKSFIKANPNAKLIAYRRFSMHMGIAEKWHYFGGE